MQLLVHRQVLTQLLLDVVVLRPLEVSSLPRVKDLAQHIWLVALPLERHRLSQSAGDDLAEQLVLHTVIQED